MKVRITNEKAKQIRVVLEPWASEYQLEPGDFLDFVSKGKVPPDGYFQVDDSDYGIIVSPEWDGALVYACNSNGEVID